MKYKVPSANPIVCRLIGCLGLLLLLVLMGDCSSGKYPTRAITPFVVPTAPAASPYPTASPLPATPGMGGGGLEGQDSQIETFFLFSFQHTAPEDILQEVALAGGGGDGGGPICWEYYGTPVETVPLEEHRGLPVEVVREQIYSLTCGWQPDEEVHITIDAPDGLILAKDARATSMEGDWGVYLVYSTTLDNPAGQYRITFSGQSGTIATWRHVIQPAQPRLLWYPDEEGTYGPGKMWIYNFAPHERIRVFAYQRSSGEEGPDGRLVAWQDLQVGAEGQLTLRVETQDFQDVAAYAAVGERSGEAASYSKYHTTFFPMLGESARAISYVVTDSDCDLYSPEGYYDPGAEVIGQVGPNTRLNVVDSFRSWNGDLWWLVRLDDGSEGWINDECVTLVPDSTSGARGEGQAIDEIFRISPSNQAVPEDVLQEVALFAGGGGPGPVCTASEGSPVVLHVPDDARATQTTKDGVYVLACGWLPDEEVHADLSFPDGRSVSEILRPEAGETYTVTFFYPLSVNDPPGNYTLTLRGDSGVVASSYSVTIPSGPHLLWDAPRRGDPADHGQLFLYGFEPYEQIRLLAYENQGGGGSGSFVGWQWVRADSDGRLVIHPEWEGQLYIGAFVALGEASGEAFTFKYYLDIFWPVLGGSILKVRYVVAVVDVELLDNVEGDLAASRIVKQVRVGTRMEVLASWWREDRLWWYVRLEDGVEGWVPDELVNRVIE